MKLMLTKILSMLGLTKPISSDNIGLNLDGSVPLVKTELKAKEDSIFDEVISPTRRYNEAKSRIEARNERLAGVKSVITKEDLKKMFEDAAESNKSGTYRYVADPDPRKRLRSTYKPKSDGNQRRRDKHAANSSAHDNYVNHYGNDDFYESPRSTSDSYSGGGSSYSDSGSSCDTSSSSSSCSCD